MAYNEKIAQRAHLTARTSGAAAAVSLGSYLVASLMGGRESAAGDTSESMSAIPWETIENTSLLAFIVLVAILGVSAFFEAHQNEQNN